MDKQAVIASFLKQLGQEAGLGELKLNRNGVLTLDIDGQTYGLHFFTASDEFYVISRLGSLPENDRERTAMMALLLEKNCFFSATDKGVIGVPDSDSIIYYTARIEVEGMEYSEFKKAFFHIVDICIKLRKDLADGASAAPVSSGNELDFMNMLRV